MRLDSKLLKALSVRDRREARRMFRVALKRYVDPLDYFRTSLTTCELTIKNTPHLTHIHLHDLWARQVIAYRACVAALEMEAKNGTANRT